MVRETLANDERVGEFLQRPLSGAWPYLWLDAAYLKVRQGGRVRHCRSDQWRETAHSRWRQ